MKLSHVLYMKLDYVKFVGEIEIYPSTKIDKRKKAPTKVTGEVQFIESPQSEGKGKRKPTHVYVKKISYPTKY